MKPIHNELLEYHCENGKHAARLIHLLMSRSNDGTVTPNIKRCMEEVIDVVGDEYDDEAVYILLDYLLKTIDRS